MQQLKITFYFTPTIKHSANLKTSPLSNPSLSLSVPHPSNPMRNDVGPSVELRFESSQGVPEQKMTRVESALPALRVDVVLTHFADTSSPPRT